MPNPQTATERFLRHGVAGGFDNGRIINWDKNRILMTPDQAKALDNYLFLDPALWQACGRSLGWPPALSDGEPQGSEWLQRWHGLLDWLAAHPGDVEGYLSQIIGGKENV